MPGWVLLPIDAHCGGRRVEGLWARGDACMRYPVQDAASAIVVRKPKLAFDEPIDRFYMCGNPVKTHFFNALNLLFPEGERFFVKSVHDHAQQIDDPALQQQIRAFAGQEGQHANQHERFFTVLEEQGYAVDAVMKPFLAVTRVGKKLPRALRLAMTAGAEHYTASMAAMVLEHDMLSECHPTLRQLITWHAIEEIEHKHVAYDVFVKVYPRSYLLRMFGFISVTLLIATFTAIGLRAFLKQDARAGRMTRKQYKVYKAELSGPKERAFQKATRNLLLRYWIPGFHPNQKDDGALLERFVPQVDAGLA